MTGLVVLFCYFAVAQGTGYSWDFSDCELKDILCAVSVDTGISIVPDDTVSGKGDLKFAGSDFETAFDAFLKANRLFVKKENGVWTVSRINVSFDEGCYSVEAYDLLPVNVIMPEDKEEFALTMNGKKSNLCRNDFLVFAESAGISQKTADAMIRKMLSFASKWMLLCKSSLLPSDMKQILAELMQARIERLS